MVQVTANATLKTTAYAGRLRRLVAYTIDTVLLYGAVFISQFVIYAITNGRIFMTLNEPHNKFWLWGWIFLTVVIPIWGYFAISESSTKQATLGKRILSLQVTDTAGNRLSVRHAWLRTIAKLGYLEIGHIALVAYLPTATQTPPPFPTSVIVVLYGLMGLYVAVMALTPRRQSVHDLLVGTVVVQHSKPRVT